MAKRTLETAPADIDPELAARSRRWLTSSSERVKQSRAAYDARGGKR